MKTPARQDGDMDASIASYVGRPRDFQTMVTLLLHLCGSEAGQALLVSASIHYPSVLLHRESSEFVAGRSLVRNLSLNRGINV